MYERIENDPLPQRDKLSVMANRLIKGGKEGGWEVSHICGGVRVIREGKTDGKITVTVGEEEVRGGGRSEGGEERRAGGA